MSWPSWWRPHRPGMRTNGAIRRPTSLERTSGVPPGPPCQELGTGEGLLETFGLDDRGGDPHRLGVVSSCPADPSRPPRSGREPAGGAVCRSGSSRRHALIAPAAPLV